MLTTRYLQEVSIYGATYLQTFYFKTEYLSVSSKHLLYSASISTKHRLELICHFQVKTWTWSTFFRPVYILYGMYLLRKAVEQTP